MNILLYGIGFFCLLGLLEKINNIYNNGRISWWAFRKI